MLAKLNRFKLKQSITDLAYVCEIADKVDLIICQCYGQNPGDILVFKSELLLDALLTNDKTNKGVVPLMVS